MFDLLVITLRSGGGIIFSGDIVSYDKVCTCVFLFSGQLATEASSMHDPADFLQFQCAEINFLTDVFGC